LILQKNKKYPTELLLVDMVFYHGNNYKFIVKKLLIIILNRKTNIIPLQLLKL